MSTVRTCFFCMIVAALAAQAQVANHEPGETWGHFRTVERSHERCTVGAIRDPEPGQCVVAPWAGKSYFFRNGVLYRSEVHLGTDYDEVINLLTARYGKPASRQNQFEMIGGRVSTHVTWFKAAAFDVLAYQESYVDEEGNSHKATYVLSTNESRTKKEKENTNF